ncbi:MAG: ABC transporter substrate-binding protein [Lachnospiraceae bacterium]|nr:ABC transporter substrate-binding protein [Lachnospiraceae bacterium]
MKKIEIKKNYLIIILMIFMLAVTSCDSQGVASLQRENNKNGKIVSYMVDITMEGGSGKAYIESPVTITEDDTGIKARLEWSSPNYDYMIIDGIKYLNESTSGNSVFTVPVKDMSKPLAVTADTVAMSVPHEIEYIIYWGNADKPGTGDNIKTDVNEAEDGDIYIPGEIDGNPLSGRLELEYATRFTVREYGEYRLINIENSGSYLIVPGDKDIPGDVPGNVTVLKKPLDATYLVSTSVMDHISTLDCLDMIRFSSLKAEDWYVEKAGEYMESGSILYAGKYRAPDYELLLNNDCDLAIENTMIYHNPEVKEKLEELGIPVLVETSSYEEHPLGRLEWIKLYGILYDKEEAADKYYREQLDRIAPLLRKTQDTGLKVAFFNVTANKLINVRKPGDYISKMISMAGGNYIINEDVPDDENTLSSMNMQMEDFYAAAIDADIIIYNSTVVGEIHSVNDLLSLNGLFADFKAVKEDRVYCIDPSFFQKPGDTAVFISDLNSIFTGGTDNLTYIKKLE